MPGAYSGTLVSLARADGRGLRYRQGYRPQAVPALDAVCTMGRVPLGLCMPATEEHRPAAEGADQAVEISWRLACFVGNGSNPIKTGGIASRCVISLV